MKRTVLALLFVALALAIVPSAEAGPLKKVGKCLKAVGHKVLHPFGG